MLNWIRKHSGHFFTLPFFSSILIVGIYFLNENGKMDSSLWKLSMWTGAFALFTALLMLLVNTKIANNLPSNLKNVAWVHMTEEDFKNCGGYGVAGLLLGTASVAIFSCVLGWFISLVTIILIFNKEIV